MNLDERCEQILDDLHGGDNIFQGRAAKRTRARRTKMIMDIAFSGGRGVTNRQMAEEYRLTNIQVGQILKSAVDKGWLIKEEVFDEGRYACSVYRFANWR